MEKSTLDWSRFGENLKKFRTKTKMTQKDLGARLGQIDERSAQSRIAKMENGTIIPNSTELINILDIFNISIDDLLGRNSGNFYQKDITPRFICRFISNLTKKNMFISSIQRHEHCYEEILNFEGMTEISHEYKANAYPCIFFSNWTPILDEEDAMIASQIGNSDFNGKKINHFLNRLMKIHKMKLDGDIDDEMYNILLEKYLDDVPDK